MLAIINLTFVINVVINDNHRQPYSSETTEELRAAKEESLQGDTPEGVITTLSRVPRFHTLRIRGVVQGHRIGVLIDGGDEYGCH